MIPFAHVLPHRPPMVWIDEVLVSGAAGGTCAVDLNPAQPYFGADGRCLAFAPVEWIAQAFGYARAVHTADPAAVSRAYLAGISSVVLERPLPVSGRLIVDALLTRELAPLALVSGVVRGEDGTVFARASLKIFVEPAAT